MGLKRFEMPLVVSLTEDEVRDRARELAETTTRKKRSEEIRKVVAGRFRARIKARAERIQLLAETVQTGRETRPVKVEERIDPEDHRVVLVYRLDTEEVVSRRPATHEDLQLPLPAAAPRRSKR